jgi:hypothetical protein
MSNDYNSNPDEEQGKIMFYKSDKYKPFLQISYMNNNIDILCDLEKMQKDINISVNGIVIHYIHSKTENTGDTQIISSKCGIGTTPSMTSPSIITAMHDNTSSEPPTREYPNLLNDNE